MRIKYSLALVLLLAVGCSQADKALVTIDLGLNKQARVAAPSLFDRVLAFLAMSTPAAADPSPYGQITELSIVITGPGMEPIVKEYIYNPDVLSPELTDGIINIEVPSGPERQFVIFAAIPSEGTYYFIGTARVDLPAGNVSLNIVMRELPGEPYGISTGLISDGIELAWEAGSGSPIRYIISRAESLDNVTYSPYYYLGQTTDTIYDDYNVVMDMWYMYEIYPVNQYGMGVVPLVLGPERYNP
jgi:hypothetical protein